MGYKNGPWTFRGRALYQLTLVKVEEARKYIPDGLHIVNLFGYTVGGFYLARYSESPVGDFDELVALAGLVWNAPTSCAWAARVYVSNWEARDHGRRHCGLPSRYAAFREGAGEPRMRKDTNWWQQSTLEEESTGRPIVLHNEERRSWRQLWKAPTEGLSVPVCSMELPPARQGGWAGPRIHMKLPSFSGATAECPDLLHYACQLRTNVRAVQPARVQVSQSREEESKEMVSAILGAKPLLALTFDNMEMVVDEPKVAHASNAAKCADEQQRIFA